MPGFPLLRCLLPLILATQALAQQNLFRQVFDSATDTHVEVTALFTEVAPTGYFPVRVKIANNLQTDRDVHLEFTSLSGNQDEIVTRTGFDLSAAAGKTVTRDLMVPLAPVTRSYGYNSSQLQLQMSGSLGRASGHIGSNTSPGQPAVLLSDALFTPNASRLDGAFRGKFSSSSGSSKFAGQFDPKQLPDDWLAFSGYDCVILTDGDWTSVPPGGRNAILSWVRLGGQLIICGSSDVSRNTLGLPADAGLGTIEFLPGSSPSTLDPLSLIAKVVANPNKDRQASILDDHDGSWPLQLHFGSQTFRYSLFVVVLILFAILVGPVNLFVFAKSGRRHRLFITTPIISLGASLVLIALILFQDGFGGRGVRRILMEVRPDEGVNAAFLQQEQFSRTGVLMGSQFTVSTPAIINPVPINPSRWARFTNTNGRGTFNLQPQDGKIQASGDWFQSRSEHGHVLSAVVSTRGRIEKTDQAGTFLSTFDYPLETIFYLDAARQWHRAADIQPGKRFTFQPVDATVALPALAKEATAFSRRNRVMLEAAQRRGSHFVAITGAAPGIDTLPGIRWSETRTVITGPVSDKP